MYLAVSHFSVANTLGDSVREAFCQRPHLVDSAVGFIRMEIANPCKNPNEFWLFTWWQEEANFREWYRSHAFQESHIGIPKGLKLLPDETRFMDFDVIAH
jgi:heme-degrading monooxygenase HmoA